MAGLSIYSDGLPLLDPPHLTPCSNSADPLDSPSTSTSTAETEAELWRLFHQISGSGGFLKHSSGDLVSEILGFGLLPGSPTLCIDHSELLDHWIQKLCSAREDRRAPLCPDLKRRIKQLIGKLLNERIAGLEDDHAMSSGKSSSGGRARKCNPLSDMLLNLRGVATDPFGQMSPVAVQERKEEILRARQALFVNMADVPNTEDFPYRKKYKTNQSPHGASTAYLYLKRPRMEQSGKPGSEILQPTRRSKRTFGLLKLNESFLPRKRIPCGDDFQAVVPQWTGPLVQRVMLEDNENLDDSKWQGTRIWPIEEDDRETSENMIGKGRPQSCSCSSPGSVDCIRFHVKTSRLHLKSELGQAFFNWEFDKMGENVSQLWTDKEKMMFDDLIKLNPASKRMSFWKPALEYFTSKSSQDIASYYFNVHVLRKIIKQTRSESGTADSSEEDNASENANDD